MNNNYIQQNLNSIKHILSNNIETINELRSATKESDISIKHMIAVKLVEGVAEMYTEIKHYLTDEETKEIKGLLSEVNEIFETIEL